MMRIRKIIAKFVDLFRPEYSFKYEEEFPDSIKENTIYIIGQKLSPWVLSFFCPCGCKSIIQLNLLKEADPNWKYRITVQNKITISPSIRRTFGCKSHFFIRNSKVEWAKNRKRFTR